MAPQGTIPRGEAFFEPRLKGRWGAARLAHATRAPVIPVGVWGTERVWPRNSRLPRFDLRHRPLVQVQVGPPVTMAYRSVDADTGRIMAALVDLLPDEARIRKEPSSGALAAARFLQLPRRRHPRNRTETRHRHLTATKETRWPTPGVPNTSSTSSGA